MRVNVHVEDVVLPIECGEGRQKLKWLASVCCIRYGLLQNAFPHQYSTINVKLIDDEHVTLWIRDSSLDEKTHFSDSVLAGSIARKDKGYHLARLTGDTVWEKGFHVAKGQSGQDALRHVMHLSAVTQGFKRTVELHGDFYHVPHPSMTTLVCSEALGDGDVATDRIYWSKRFQEAWDKTDIFDLLVDQAGGEVVRGPNRPTAEAHSYTSAQKELLVELGSLLYEHFDALCQLFDFEAVEDPLVHGNDRLSMLAFLHLLKKCNVPHPDIPMAAFDRVFIEVNWTSDPLPDHAGRAMDLGEFLESLIRVANVRYANDPDCPSLLEAVRKLLVDKVLPQALDVHADPFLRHWHTKMFMQIISHQSRPLNRAFKMFANMDHDMHFFTMSLKEWKYFCSVLEITTGKAAVVTQRQIRQSFWRAQGAFAPDHGSAVAVKEREEFLEKISADPEEEDADKGNLQEMNYLEFVEGVARLAFHLHRNQLEEAERETDVDHADVEGMVHYLHHIIDRLRHVLARA